MKEEYYEYQRAGIIPENRMNSCTGGCSIIIWMTETILDPGPM